MPLPPSPDARRSGAAARFPKGYALITAALWLIALLFIAEGYDRHTPSNDEWVQHTYGELLWDFWLSGGRDKTFLSFSNLYLYGGLFDLIAAIGTRLLGLEWWPWRHLLTALCGLVALWGIARLARFVADRAAAVVAVALTLLTGPFWGAIFTHTKDIPFAAAMVWALYYTVRLARDPTTPRRRHVFLWGVATGAALGIRVGAVLIPFFLAVGVTASLLSRLLATANAPASGSLCLRFRATLVTFAVALGRFLVALLPGVALLVAIVTFAWPWSVMGWDHLWLAITKFSHFAFDLYTWEEGVRLKNSDVSRFYLLHYLLVRLPEVVWFGLLFWVGSEAAATDPKRPQRLLVAFAALFIVGYVTATRPPLYNGIRHFLFLVPWLLVLAAVGWWRVILLARSAMNHRLWGAFSLALATLALGGALALRAAWVLVTLHPYEHLYYNALAGGLKAADEEWETDHWSDATRALIPAIRDWLQSQPPGKVAYLAYCADGFQIEPWLPENVVITEDWRDADLFLSTTHDNCHYVMNGRVVAQIERRGVVLAVLKEVDRAAPFSSPVP